MNSWNSMMPSVGGQGFGPGLIRDAPHFYDYSGATSKTLASQWDGLETDWEWGYEEQQQQVAGLMAALLPPSQAAEQDAEFREVSSRRARRKDTDPDVMQSPREAQAPPLQELQRSGKLNKFASNVPREVMQQLQDLEHQGCNLAGMLDDRAWSALTALRMEDGVQVVQQVATQLTKTPAQIRNVNAVLMSHAGKFLREHTRPGAPPVLAQTPKQVPMTKKVPVMPAKARDTGNLSCLSPDAQYKARELITLFEPYLTITHFDSGIVGALKQMGDTNAQMALDAIKANCSGRGARDWSKLTNPSAYIMSIINPYTKRPRA